MGNGNVARAKKVAPATQSGSRGRARWTGRPLLRPVTRWCLTDEAGMRGDGEQSKVSADSRRVDSRNENRGANLISSLKIEPQFALFRNSTHNFEKPQDELRALGKHDFAYLGSSASTFDSELWQG